MLELQRVLRELDSFVDSLIQSAVALILEVELAGAKADRVEQT
jgi:hypothetical protein